MERGDTSTFEMTAFMAVAQAGSFTQAAETLGTTKSSVTKAVQRIEARMETRLFHRTTRAVRLTEDGEIYQAAVRIALDSLQDAEQSIASRRIEPSGRVRLNLPSAFGRLMLDPLARLRHDYPKITLELSFTDRMSDPVAEGWDIIVRIGELPPDSGMTVRKICHLRFGLYASPGYLERTGRLRSIAELTARDAVVYRASSGRLRPWAVRREDGEVEEISPHPSVIVADGQALADAVTAGYGIAQMLDGIVHPYHTAGSVEHVLPQADVDGLPVHAIIPVGQKMTAKTRFVLDYLTDAIRSQLGVDLDLE